jgi:pyruvate carboxylase
MALFMVQNNLSAADVLERGQDLAYPESFVQLIQGLMGQPPGGWPPALMMAIPAHLIPKARARAW